MFMTKISKKILSFLTIIIQIFSLFNFLLFTSIQVNAATNTWNFDLTGDYTYSSTTAFTVSWSLAYLNQNTLEHTWVITNATNYNWAYDIVVDWSYAYMTSYLWDRVTILNISNPASPTLVSQIINNWWTIRLDWAAWIVKDWNFLYVASNVSDALQIINVTNPAAPTAAWQVLNTTTTRLDWARWIDKVWNYVYIASNVSDSLTIIDVTNPASPTYIWKYRVNNWNLNWARDVKVVGNYAYVANYDRDSLAVMDISNPANPTFVVELRQTTRLNWAHNLVISWNYAYVSADLNASVMVIDISNPASPTEVTNISWWNYSLTNPRDLVVDDNKLFITSYWNDAINVADITNPASPTYITKILHNAGNPLLDWVDWLFKVWNLIYSAVYISDALEILKLNYDTTSPFLQPATSFNYWSDALSSFTEILWWWNQWSITYQISKNNWTTWYYWNWSTWTTTVWWVENSSSASTINSNLTSFNALPWWTSQFTYKAFFTSNWDQKVELDSVILITNPPPTPGWVSSNLVIWLKSNAWTSTTTDWVSLTSWNDQSWNWYNAWWWVAPTYRFNNSDNLNFNPLIDFNWSQYLDNLNNWANSRSYFMVIVPDNQVDWTLAWQVPFWWDCNSWVLSSWTCWLPFAWWVLWAFTVAINDEVITHAIWASTSWRSSQIWAATYNASRPMLIWFNENSWANWTDIYEKWVKIDNYTANTYQALSTADYRIWRSMDWANIFPYTWKIAEIINYSSRVSDSDRLKIESYLAIKYGITLNNWTQNYTASNWSTSIWNTTTAWAFTNAIFWIGRDDWSSLSQIKSKSSNPDWVVTINTLWEWTNMSPSFVDMQDLEFLSISDNSSSNTWIQAWSPTWYNILSRQWRVQETWDVWNISLDFDVANTNFDIPALLSWSLYYFVYDSDNDNLLTDETPIAMTNLWWNVWQVWSINLSNWMEFTIATQASTNNIPTNITLSNSSINENVASGSTIGTFTTTDSDPWDSHTYSFISWVWDTDNSSFTISWSTLKIAESPDYELQNSYSIRVQTDDWNWWLFQKQFTITINDLWEAINSIIDFEIAWKYTVTSWNWTRTTVNPYEWTYSIESNNWWTPNTQSCFEVTNTFSQTWTVEFYYNVSSEVNDYLRFYIDNVEQQWWSWNIPWSLYSKNDISAWTHSYKWCYIKDWTTNWWSDKAWVDYITYKNTWAETIPPNILSINYASWTLLPWWNHNLIINYTDLESGINTWSALISLYKWDWVSSWGSDISASWLNLAWKIITTTSATYPTNNLVFWKYRYDFQISDNSWNSSSTWAVFYIDQPEIIVSTWSFNVWTLSWTWLNFSSNEITITIKTVWASYQAEISKDTNFQTSWWSIIIDWDWIKWVWYDKNPYNSINKNINSNQIIWTWTTNINTNWLKNTYTHNIKIWNLIDLEQAAWTYQMNLSFRAIFGY